MTAMDQASCETKLQMCPYTDINNAAQKNKQYEMKCNVNYDE